MMKALLALADLHFLAAQFPMVKEKDQIYA
jgi:hypothetical protein